VAARTQRVDLAEQHDRVDHHALTENAARAGAQMPLGKRRTMTFSSPTTSDVTGVGAAGVTHDDLGELRVEIDDLALAFVTPAPTIRWLPAILMLSVAARAASSVGRRAAVSP
jgi:hypothetical protein